MSELAHELASWQPILIRLAGAGDGADGAHDIDHLHRVWANASALMSAEPSAADPLTVMAACYLHDLVNVPKNDPRRPEASRLSARYALEVLSAAGFPPALLDGVAHAIEAHSFSAALPARTAAARIVQDADRLDALGAVGLARLFYTAGRMGSSLAHGGDPLGRARALDDRRYALDHVVVKLATLPALMQTQAGRVMGQQRLQRLLEFREAFAAEWGAPD
ncbi:MAG: HD domain-containing protein [Massilia sp.]